MRTRHLQQNCIICCLNSNSKIVPHGAEQLKLPLNCAPQPTFLPYCQFPVFTWSFEILHPSPYMLPRSRRPTPISGRHGGL
jgi:hypothetical protein